MSVKTQVEGSSFVHIAARAERNQLSELFFELHRQRVRAEAWSHALSLNLLERILILAHSGQARLALDPRIRKVVESIEKNLPPLSIPQLAEHAGLSVSRLTSLYRQQLGESILATINRVRLRAAH